MHRMLPQRLPVRSYSPAMIDMLLNIKTLCGLGRPRELTCPLFPRPCHSHALLEEGDYYKQAQPPRDQIFLRPKGTSKTLQFMKTFIAWLDNLRGQPIQRVLQKTKSVKIKIRENILQVKLC